MTNLISTIQNMCYIDPAATSVLISSITAIVVALGATFIIIWRKMKRGVQKTLHIDENAGKVVEDDLVILDEEATENGANTETKEEAPAPKKETTTTSKAKSSSVKKPASTKKPAQTSTKKPASKPAKK